MAWLLAWRNLAHDRARFAVTLVGIVFAVVLIAMQAGLFLGFADTTTVMIRHSRADFWIVAKGTQFFEAALPISERELYLARSVPGVASAERVFIQFAPWEKPQGGQETVTLVGADLNTGLVGPWNVVAGNPADLRLPDAVMVDRIYTRKLGIAGAGATVEINGKRARVVGLTDGIRAFSTAPWVFTSYRNALGYAKFDDEMTTFVIGTIAPGANPDSVRAELALRLPRSDVYLTEDFAKRTRDYWLLTTGAGASVLLSAVLGLLVGAVIVAQVLYATTMDHLAEYGTLRAMGAPSGFVYQVILGQAAISGTLGHLPGVAVSLSIAKISESTTALILVPLWLVVALYGVTLAMCMLASVVSIRKAMGIDPAMVFQR